MARGGVVMKIAVLCDGAGLARLGLEMAGHTCTGFEIDPAKHHLSRMVGSGNCVLADVRDVDLSGFDAVWASPPCQPHSDQNHSGKVRQYGDASLLWWCLSLPHDVLWVENVISHQQSVDWGMRYNAVQFLEVPIQKRRRMIGGRFPLPETYRPYQANYPHLDVCPAVLASEYGQGGLNADPAKERRKASRWYGRGLSLREMAYHQGFEIPDALLKSWFHTPPGYTDKQWRVNISQAIGNGVPVYMARAFGEAAARPRIHAGTLFELGAVQS